MLTEEVGKLKVEGSKESQDSVPSAKRPRVQSESQSLLLTGVEEMLEHSSDSEMEPESPEIVITAYLKEPNLPLRKMSSLILC